MNIGNTPQEKLAVIKHINKRVLISGLVIGVFFTMICPAMYGGIASFLLPLPISLVAMGAFIWGFYWLSSKFNLLQVSKILASSVTYSEHYEFPIEPGETGITKRYKADYSTVWIVLLIGFPIVSYVGLYYVIKHFILYFVLKGKLKKEAAKLKKEADDLNLLIDSLAEQLITEHRSK